MTASNTIPQDNKAYRFPVSVKGIVYQDGKVVLLKNERDEWELPGGKLELGEAPEFCVVREIEEELGLVAKTGPLLDSWVYHIYEGGRCSDPHVWLLSHPLFCGDTQSRT